MGTHLNKFRPSKIECAACRDEIKLEGSRTIKTFKSEELKKKKNKSLLYHIVKNSLQFSQPINCADNRIEAQIMLHPF